MATLQQSTFTDLSLPTGTTAQRPGSPVAGMMRYNTDIALVEYYDGSDWRPVTGFSNGPQGSGGDQIFKRNGGFVHMFTTVQSTTFTPSFTGYVQVLIVAGGGGAGANSWSAGGGGGGVIFNRAYPVTSGVGIGVTTGGGGGSSSGTGGNSIFGATTANGGGGGGWWDGVVGRPGGSGGGGGPSSSDGSRLRLPGGPGITGQGFPGGSGVRFNDDGSDNHMGGGGGGAGGPGHASNDLNGKMTGGGNDGGPGCLVSVCIIASLSRNVNRFC